jgi:hypothetical protein
LLSFHSCTPTNTYTHTHIPTHKHTQTHTHAHTHTHTHTHIHSWHSCRLCGDAGGSCCAGGALNKDISRASR